jgi:ATP-dependent HslUV protease ATP-binding subunit HslU
LGKADLVRILTEPENALIKQYTALLETESVKVNFTEDGIAEIAEMAALINDRTENIGARRLYTMMEKLLDEISFDAPEMSGKSMVIDAKYVREKLKDFVEDEDLSRYIL